jgi:hypothetical protein
MTSHEPQSSILWIRDAARGVALVGGVPIWQRMDPIVDKARSVRDLGREILTDGTSLLRDLVRERPLIVVGAVGFTAVLLARFASARALTAAATIGDAGRESRSIDLQHLTAATSRWTALFLERRAD